MGLLRGKPIRSNVTIPATSFSRIFFQKMTSCVVVIMTSFMIPSPSILNIRRRRRLTALPRVHGTLGLLHFEENAGTLYRDN